MGKLRFVFGPSGSGKTTDIYRELLSRAKKSPDTNFLIIVPDQFTLQTQFEVSEMSMREGGQGGILNIDVLSFGRLTHRIMQEVGWKELPVLDDTGKCLVLQRVAGRISEELPLLGSRLHRQGYVHEVKSVISEFMQYGIGPDGLDRMLEAMKEKGALTAKLRDLQTIYRSFQEYLAGNFITREEKLDVLRQVLPKSAILPGSVVVFDGFTGFTPIQANVIEDIMAIADETIVSLVLGEGVAIEDAAKDEQNLFYLSGKTYTGLCKRAEGRGVMLSEAKYCRHSSRVPAIDFIEKNLFRNNNARFEKGEDGKYPGITLVQATSVPEEVHQVGLKICKLLRENSRLQYRNFVIATGNLETYAPYIEREFSRMGIPYFLDRTGGIRLNPIAELIRSCLMLYVDNFSMDSVIRYMRTGLAGFDPEEIDRLEIYVRRRGIRGRKKWEERFAIKAGRTDDKKVLEGLSEAERDERRVQIEAEQEAELQALNDTREKFMNQLAVLRIKNKDTAENYVNNMYDYLVAMDVAGGLESYAQFFEARNDLVREKEYSQIYKKVMELLEQIISLMGSDVLTLREFYEILDAGFGEIRIGSIPQTVDKVMVGDIERSRVSSVEIMFFLGVNDGNIPKSSDKGGILSDIDRENLRNCDFELAPTPREAMYTQRLYLYLNMTKPVRELYISWAGIDPDGKSMRPSYICEILKRMYPGIMVEMPEKLDATEQIVSRQEGIRYLSDGLRRFVEGSPSEDEKKQLFTIYEAYSDGDIRKKMTDAAFIQYIPVKLSRDIAEQLYCKKNDEYPDSMYMSSSVSQLETYNKCPYEYFLRYGLRLRESKEFAIGKQDTGNIYHEVIAEFCKWHMKKGNDWVGLSEAVVRDKVKELLHKSSVEYGDAQFYDTERSSYTVSQMEKTLVTTIMTMRYQICKGDFIPTAFEKKFNGRISIGNINNAKTKLFLNGFIDRVDMAQTQEGRLVRIVDYKSSSHTLDVNDVYDGLALQLPLYMGQELDKNDRPASMLYYHLNNPVIEYKENESNEEREKRIRDELRMKGISNDDMEVLYRIDKDLMERPGKSDVVAVRIKKEGLFYNDAQVLGEDEIKTVIDYSYRLAAEKGCEIVEGNINVNPADKKSCEYCPYKNACQFDVKIPGYQRKSREKKETSEVLAAMKEKIGGN